jgi:RNA polymerase sigma-70 factor, ECF subfamily
MCQDFSSAVTNSGVGNSEFPERSWPGRDEAYRRAADEYGRALERLAYAYEADPDRRRDLVQEIHLALWRSFETFDGRCSLRTWVYRVAHNVATSHMIRQGRWNRKVGAFLTLEEIEAQASTEDVERSAGRNQARTRLLALIQKLELTDRQVILAYLEGFDAESIGEITGLSTANVWTRVHRIKSLLVQQFQAGVSDAK